MNAVSRGDVIKNPCSVSSTDSLGSSPRNSRCLMLAGQVRLFLVWTNVCNGKPSATAAVGLRARSYRCRSSSGRGSGGHKARTWGGKRQYLKADMSQSRSFIGTGEHEFQPSQSRIGANAPKMAPNGLPSFQQPSPTGQKLVESWTKPCWKPHFFLMQKLYAASE